MRRNIYCKCNYCDIADPNIYLTYSYNVYNLQCEINSPAIWITSGIECTMTKYVNCSWTIDTCTYIPLDDFEYLCTTAHRYGIISYCPVLKTFFVVVSI